MKLIQLSFYSLKKEKEKSVPKFQDLTQLDQVYLNSSWRIQPPHVTISTFTCHGNVLKPMFPLPVNQVKHEPLDKIINMNTESWNSTPQNSEMLQVIQLLRKDITLQVLRCHYNSNLFHIIGHQVTHWQFSELQSCQREASCLNTGVLKALQVE